MGILILGFFWYHFGHLFDRLGRHLEHFGQALGKRPVGAQGGLTWECSCSLGDGPEAYLWVRTGLLEGARKLIVLAYAAPLVDHDLATPLEDDFPDSDVPDLARYMEALLRQSGSSLHHQIQYGTVGVVARFEFLSKQCTRSKDKQY